MITVLSEQPFRFDLGPAQIARGDRKGSYGIVGKCDCGEIDVYVQSRVPNRCHSCISNPVEIGQRFDRLIVLDIFKRGNRSLLRVLCDCGSEKEVDKYSVTGGRATSCGCALLEIKTTHGMSKHSHYQRWYGMMARCYKEYHSHYGDYGGRGVEVCEEWHDVVAFCQWIDENLGPCPEGYSLDRIDNNGDYEPNNVRWADSFTQANNRRGG